MLALQKAGMAKKLLYAEWAQGSSVAATFSFRPTARPGEVENLGTNGQNAGRELSTVAQTVRFFFAPKFDKRFRRTQRLY